MTEYCSHKECRDRFSKPHDHQSIREGWFHKASRQDRSPNGSLNVSDDWESGISMKKARARVPSSSSSSSESDEDEGKEESSATKYVTKQDLEFFKGLVTLAVVSKEVSDPNEYAHISQRIKHILDEYGRSPFSIPQEAIDQLDELIEQLKERVVVSKSRNFFDRDWQSQPLTKSETKQVVDAMDWSSGSVWKNTEWDDHDSGSRKLDDMVKRALGKDAESETILRKAADSFDTGTEKSMWKPGEIDQPYPAWKPGTFDNVPDRRTTEEMVRRQRTQAVKVDETPSQGHTCLEPIDKYMTGSDGVRRLEKNMRCGARIVKDPTLKMCKKCYKGSPYSAGGGTYDASIPHQHHSGGFFTTGAWGKNQTIMVKVEGYWCLNGHSNAKKWEG